METSMRSTYVPGDDLATRTAELEDRERAVSAREQLILALERRLEESRRRLETRIEQAKERRALAAAEAYLASGFRLPAVDVDYFAAGSLVNEDAWWERQLGKPQLVA
jgi:hypothetical protein